MPNYLELLKKEFNDLDKIELDLIKKDEVIFDSFADAEDTLREYLNMSEVDFKKFKETEEYNAEWNDFCNAEQEFIKQKISRGMA